MSYVGKIHKIVEQRLLQQFPKAVLDNVLLPYVDPSTIIVCIFTHNDYTRIENALNSIQFFADYICLLDIESTDDTVNRVHQWHRKEERGCILDVTIDSDHNFLSNGGVLYVKNRLLAQSKRLAAAMELNLDSTYVCWLATDVLWNVRRAYNPSTPSKDKEYFEQVKWRLTEQVYNLLWNGSVWDRLESGLLLCLSLSAQWIGGHTLSIAAKNGSVNLPPFELDFQ